MEELIKRSDVTDEISHIIPYRRYHNGEFTLLYSKYEVVKAIEVIPVVEPKQGEWITVDTEVISVPVYWNKEQRQFDERGAGILEKCECSVCGWKTNFMGYKKLGVNKSYNFCPNCGAK